MGVLLGTLFAVPAAQATSPGANGRIAFTSLRGGGRDIYVMNADGSGQVNLTNDPASDYDAAWSPDGTRIAFVSDRDGNNEVFVMNADGTGQVNLTNNLATYDLYPTWSPDGTRIAFTSTRDGDEELYVMNADGTGQVRLTNVPTGRNYQPAWSPDGTRIAFTSTRDGDNDVYVMNADGTGQVNLTNDPATDWTPAWSPDGTRITFGSYRNGEAELYAMNADGTEPVNLTNDPANDEDGTWSPDGATIAFVTTRDGATEIYAMNADGTGQVNLTNAPGYDSGPDWQAFAGTTLEPPIVTGAEPGSPANDNTVLVTGSAEPGATVDLYATTDCTGIPSATGTAAELASPGLEVTVDDDTTTTIRATAANGVGARSACSASFVTYVEDSTAPAITVVSEITADATDPGGAVVAYDAAATDGVSGTVPVNCTPASGERFSIGRTDVECTATDQAGNTSIARIQVTVRGAPAQLDDLIAAVRAAPLTPGTRTVLVRTLLKAQYWMGRGREAHAHVALEVFVFEIRVFQFARRVPPPLALAWIQSARRIELVMG
jgi:Tol biopolymer transport system component